MNAPSNADKAYRELSGPTVDGDAMFAHLQEEHNWTPGELYAILDRLRIGGARLHRIEHEEHPDSWDHVHG